MESGFASSVRRISIVLAVLVVGYVTFFCKYGISPVGVGLNALRLSQAKSELAEAKVTWASHGVSHYQVTVAAGDRMHRLMEGQGSYNGGCILFTETLVVRDGVIVDYPIQACREVFDQLTIERMFDYVSYELARSDPLIVDIRVTFDADYGYITDFRLDTVQPFFSGFSDHPTTFWFSGMVELEQK